MTSFGFIFFLGHHLTFFLDIISFISFGLAHDL